MQPREADVRTAPTGSASDEKAGGGTEPAEGRPDLGLPGADREDLPPDRLHDLPERLGERLENGSSSAMATGEPDVLPDVEVPEETM